MIYATTRICLCLNISSSAISVPGWTFIDVAGPDDPAISAADCLIIDSGHACFSQPTIVSSSVHLPIVAFVTDDALDARFLDGVEAFLLAGDSDVVIGQVLDAATARGGEVRDWSDNAARTIGALGVEASRIAEALQNIAARVVPGEPEPVTAATVRRLIRLRRSRDRYLPALLFADPAWDMLLDLTAARLEQREVPVSSLCIAAAVPTTTALRWIRTMTEAGLMRRVTDPSDARRNFVALTDTAAEGVLGWLRAFSAQWRPV